MVPKNISFLVTDRISVFFQDKRPVVALNLMGLYLTAKYNPCHGALIFWVDGIFGSIASYLNKIKVKRIPGRFLVIEVLEYLVKHNQSNKVVVLGGPEKINFLNERVGHEILQVPFPFLGLSELEHFNYQQFKPEQIILIAVASPKQELIAEKIYSQTNAKCFCVGGAVFMLEGFESPAPEIIVRLGLEAVFRLRHDTKRRILRLIRVLPIGLVATFRIKLR